MVLLPIAVMTRGISASTLRSSSALVAAFQHAVFGCWIFVAFMIVDEETPNDARASAQGLYNLVIIAIGVIVGNYFAGQVDRIATTDGGTTDFQTLFSVPMWICVACLAALLVFYPKRSPAPAAQG